MPQILENELYKLDHSFFLKFDYIVRTVEQGLDIHPEKDEEEFNILSKKIYFKKK